MMHAVGGVDTYHLSAPTLRPDVIYDVPPGDSSAEAERDIYCSASSAWHNSLFLFASFILIGAYQRCVGVYFAMASMADAP
jgi:hypothetical protein